MQMRHRRRRPNSASKLWCKRAGNERLVRVTRASSPCSHMKQGSHFILTREQCRAVDRYAIEELRIPGIVLMENAGRNAAELILRWMRLSVRPPRRPQTGRSRQSRASAVNRVSIVCGKGNNGGDGMVIARHLVRSGVQVAVDLTDDHSTLSGDAAANYAIIEKMGLPTSLLTPDNLGVATRRWRQSAILVDALLGTGFSGAVREPLAGIIQRINETKPARSASEGFGRMSRQSGRGVNVPRPLVVAVDVPSGLDCDTGQVGGIAVQADRTITFLAQKPGFTTAAARPYVGKVTVVDIGAPLDLVLKMLSTENPTEHK